MQIVKLGGSVLTDKSQYRTPLLPNLARLAHEIAQSGERVAIVHGAGSYGHVLAKQHGLAGGGLDAPPGTSARQQAVAAADPARRLAAAQVHADVRELQGLLLQALHDARVPAISLSTYDLARLSSGELASFAFEPVHETLARGFVPVLSGDVVLDSARGFGILSGDVLMGELARLLRPKRAIFVTDVDGIYDKDPHESGAKLLPTVDLRQTDVRATEARVPDITGGMGGKLRRARDVAAAGVPVHVINGLAAGRLADALAGKPVVGTIMTA